MQTMFVVFLVFYLVLTALSLNCNRETEEEKAYCDRPCSQAVVKNMICDRMAKPNACVCKFGYGRHNGVCVPAAQCPADTKFQCEVLREKFHKCGTRLCEKRCSHLNEPESCPEHCNPSSYSCICNDGFARNRDGLCVRVNQCPN